VRARRVSVWVCAMIAFGAVSGAFVFHPAAVFAASGMVSVETPLHDSADPAAPVIALFPEGTIVSIDGPPVAGFYPVTAGDRSGWIRGESLQIEKDNAESDAGEEMAVDAPHEKTDETVPADSSPERDPALSTTVEPATDPAVDSSAATAASAPAADPALGDQTMPLNETLPADGMTPENEFVLVDVVAPAPDLAGTVDVTSAPTTPDGAVPLPDSEAPAGEGAAQPTVDGNVTPIPMAEIAAVGPASVMVDASILAGPGPEYGFIATAPAGSTVVQTGHVISGYATVQYAEVTGWVALDHLGAPSTGVAELSTEATAPPIEMPPADVLPAESPPPEVTPTKTPPTETPPVEIAPPTKTAPVAS
jgi:hypothetical protein